MSPTTNTAVRRATWRPATVDIVLLWLALLGTVAASWKPRPFAGAPLAPYLSWITFAGTLNFALWRLNR